MAWAPFAEGRDGIFKENRISRKWLAVPVGIVLAVVSWFTGMKFLPVRKMWMPGTARGRKVVCYSRKTAKPGKGICQILIIEDDQLIAELERDYLEASGFEVEIRLNGDDGYKSLMAGGFDTVILDIMLQGRNGFDICREIRRRLNIPVIMVTAKKEDVDKIRGLGLGADDYMVKPFSPAELVARVKSHIQIHKRLLDQREEQQESIIIRNIRILPKERRVYVDGEETALANKEYELLLFLAENPNIVFSKENLFDRVWGMEHVGNTATGTVHINRIREKIEKDPSAPPFVETVWGAGYRFRVK